MLLEGVGEADGGVLKRLMNHLRVFPLRERRLLFASIPLVIVLLIGIVGPLIVSYNPLEINLRGRLQPPRAKLLDGNTAWFGTDQLGRDIVPQVIHGARISLIVGTSTILIAGIVGVTAGLIAGFYGGAVDTVIMRLVDIQLSFPPILLAIVIAGVLGNSLLNVIVTLSVVRWAAFARIMRGTVLSLKEQEYVESACAVGAGSMRIMFHHIFPNTVSPIIVIATSQVGLQMLAEAALSFLGLGIAPPQASWGTIISQGRGYLESAWWISTLPGLVMTAAILSVGLFGDALRDSLDPHAGFFKT